MVESEIYNRSILLQLLSTRTDTSCSQVYWNVTMINLLKQLVKNCTKVAKPSQQMGCLHFEAYVKLAAATFKVY